MSAHLQRSPGRRGLRRALMLVVLLASAGWIGCNRDGDVCRVHTFPGGDACTMDAQKHSVFGLMRCLYFFNDEPEQSVKYDLLGLADFDHVEDLLDVLRYRPDEYDRGFTYITTPAAEEAFIDQGLFVGFGIGLATPSEDELFIREVFAGSPAEAEGLERGDEIIEIDGQTIAEINDGEGLGVALGPSEVGVTITFLIRPKGGGADETVTMSKEEMPLDLVPIWDIYDVGGEDVGYLLFHVFIPPAVPDLIEALEAFQTAGITKIVIDLRYNGGGLLWLAANMNDVLGGIGNVNEVQYRQRYNAANSFRSLNEVFFNDPLALNVDRIAFITSEDTASASELMINALAPYREVHVVGSRTFGKPVGQEARDYCDGDYRLRLVSFDLVNVDYEGEYFGGIAPTCPAEDDLGHALGDVNEDSLSKALTVAATGSCPVAAASAARAEAPATRRLGPPRVPWLSVY